MITVVQDWNKIEHSDILDEMFGMRAKVFSDYLKWDVRVVNGRERDRFDDESPVYVISQNDSGEVRGSCRLLPTTGPTLLSEIFSDTIPDGALLSSPTVWECTRFCVDYRSMTENDRHSMLSTSGEIVCAIGRICVSAGIDTVLGNFDRMMLKIYDRIGCKVECLGSTDRFGKTVFLGAFSVNESLLEQVEGRLRGRTQRIFTSKAA